MKKYLGILIKSSMLVAVFSAQQGTAADSCPDFLNHEFRKLHSQEAVNLCSLYSGKPILIVNTASHCGYTGQFEGLEALYQAYKPDGLEIIGFASDDFKQAAKSEEEAATVCYKNYGVTFTMLAPTMVTGKNANEVFRHLTAEAQAPGWNFNKYLVTGKQVLHFDSKVEPRESALEKALKQAL